jgi:hypothetical protein
MGIWHNLKQELAACIPFENSTRALHGRSRRLLSPGALLVTLALVSAGSLSASAITISANGTFTALTGNSTFSAPNETWAFSFVVDSQPAVSSVNSGNYFDVSFSDFQYSLDGSSVAITPVDIRFFNDSQFGGFNLCFTTACSFFNSPADGIEIEGPQMYQGSESAPTMLTGAFTSQFLDVFVDSDEYAQRRFQIVSATSSTPEPSTILPLTALLLLALVSRRLRPRSQ